MATTIQGCCYCGAVRFEADLPSLFIAHCHCDTCRRAHGAAFVTWVGFSESSFRLTSGEDLRRNSTESGAIRSFCSTCGSTLFYQHPKRFPGEIHVTLANLDWKLPPGPVENVNLDEKVWWAHFEYR